MDEYENPRPQARDARDDERTGMKKLAGTLLLFLPLALAGCAHREVVYAPPGAYSEAAQQGYRQGVHAAQNDVRSGLRPDVDRHPRFRNPPVPPPLRDDYRHGFREGYQAVFHGGPGY
jgi:hypothetical protein